jgi:hypothetical protein
VSDFIESDLGTYAQDSDSDDDGLDDGQEWTWGTGLLDPDTDGDQVLDGWDIDWIAGMVLVLPNTIFPDPRTASSTRTSLVAQLGSSQGSILRGDVTRASSDLEAVKDTIPGCERSVLDRTPPPAVCDAIDAVRDNLSAGLPWVR